MLAWRRTSLSLAVAALIISRLAIAEAAPVLMVGGVATAALALWLGLICLRRGRWSATSCSEPEFESMLRDGKLPLAVSAVAGSLCLVVLALSLGAF